MDRALTLAVPAAATDVLPEPPKIISLVVENMQCGSCMGRIERALQATPGVRHARASLAAKRVAVTIDAAATDAQKLVEALDRSG